MKKTSKQYRVANDPDSIYYKVTRRSGAFMDKYIARLKEDDYRQIWRNYILAESLFMDKERKYSDFRSITVYPAGNKHFTEKIKDFKGFLKPGKKERCMGITFEELFKEIAKYARTERVKNWLCYLQERYLV